MGVIIERDAKSLGEILSAALEIARTWSPNPAAPEELWFRGVSKKKHGLLPGLYRPNNLPFNYDEETLFERFKAQGAPFAGAGIHSDWDWYFLAQHHGLVTRLLDWTTGLLTATYFALCKSMETGDRRPYDTALAGPRATPLYDDDSPAVWMMDAGSLNLVASHNQNEDCVYAPGGEETRKYLPNDIKNGATATNRFPIAILPSHSNVRIAAQQGVFTMHGHENSSIDAIATASVPPFDIKLGRITLDRANLYHLWEELEFAGVNRLTLFPELDSVADVTLWTGQRA